MAPYWPPSLRPAKGTRNISSKDAQGSIEDAFGAHLFREWEGDKGETYRIEVSGASKCWTCTRWGKHGWSKAFTLTPDEASGRIWWGLRSAFYCEVGAEADGDVLSWYRPGAWTASFVWWARPGEAGADRGGAGAGAAAGLPLPPPGADSSSEDEVAQRAGQREAGAERGGAGAGRRGGQLGPAGAAPAGGAAAAPAPLPPPDSERAQEDEEAPRAAAPRPGAPPGLGPADLPPGAPAPQAVDAATRWPLKPPPNLLGGGAPDGRLPPTLLGGGGAPDGRLPPTPLSPRRWLDGRPPPTLLGGGARCARGPLKPPPPPPPRRGPGGEARGRPGDETPAASGRSVSGASEAADGPESEGLEPAADLEAAGAAAAARWLDAFRLAREPAAPARPGRAVDRPRGPLDGRWFDGSGVVGTIEGSTMHWARNSGDGAGTTEVILTGAAVRMSFHGLSLSGVLIDKRIMWCTSDSWWRND